MKRIREHNQDLKRLIKNERLAPNRGLLAVALSMYLDADEGEEKELFFNMLKNVWVSPKTIKWVDSEDKGDDPATIYEQQKIAQIRSAFDAVLAEHESKLPEPTEEEADGTSESFT